ncbi:MAG TPA: hypothetical protein VK696_10440 [Steroidobacteraceae bacterium]|jgi:hypothetical protein|nr:hypothetical protein [Steroidobacteraceae bacterium]
MKKLLGALITVLMLPGIVQAVEPNAFRGGWVAQSGGHNQIYMLIVRGDVVTGTYCVDCADPRNLSFIVDGHIDAAGVHFVIRHQDSHGKVVLDDARGVLQDRDLVLTVRGHEGSQASITQRLHRPPPSPNVLAVTNDEAETGALPPHTRPPYVLPGVLEVIRAEQLPGLWLWGTGPGKQYFMIQRVGTQLLGMVCGPCENPNNMAPLDGFVIDGTALTFNIVHEDTGAAVQHGPFNNVAHATLARNELHLKVVPSYEPPDSKPFEMTLLGPVSYLPQD